MLASGFLLRAVRVKERKPAAALRLLSKILMTRAAQFPAHKLKPGKKAGVAFALSTRGEMPADFYLE